MAKKSPRAPATAFDPKDAEDPVLVGPAKELYDRMRNEWQLDTAAERLLRCACEALQAANICASIVKREGPTSVEPSGRVVKHPAAVLEKDHRAQAANNLQRLTLSLDGG